MGSDDCAPGGSSITGPVFYQGGSYPGEYQGAIFFADFIRDCLWAMRPGASGLPSPANLEVVRTNTPSPVDLKLGPGGDLFYVDYNGGTIRRITFG